jgi:hypothetical protein
LKLIAINNNIVADRGAVEVENGHYVSDLGKTALPRRIPYKDICWHMGENSDRQFLFCSGKFQFFYYCTAMKVWRKYRLLAEMLMENEIVFPTIFPM